MMHVTSGLLAFSNRSVIAPVRFAASFEMVYSAKYYRRVCDSTENENKHWKEKFHLLSVNILKLSTA